MYIAELGERRIEVLHHFHFTSEFNCRKWKGRVGGKEEVTGDRNEISVAYCQGCWFNPYKATKSVHLLIYLLIMLPVSSSLNVNSVAKEETEGNGRKDLYSKLAEEKQDVLKRH